MTSHRHNVVSNTDLSLDAAAERLGKGERFFLDLKIDAHEGAVALHPILEQIGLIAMAVEPYPHFGHARDETILGETHLHRVEHRGYPIG